MNATLLLICLILTIVGGLNWGLIGLARFNLVEALFGKLPGLVRLIYIVVGIASAIVLYYQVIAPYTVVMA